MSDIFISYARQDRERAGLLAHALEQRGWSVWWDREIPPGRTFDDVIEEALGAARCAVVLWSHASAASAWVRNEASDALQRQMLIPALIDPDVKIPLEFRRVQAADLSRWPGPESAQEFEHFCAAIARNVDAPGAPGGHQRPPAPARPAGDAPTMRAPPFTTLPAKRSRWLWISIAVGIAVVAGIVSQLAEQASPVPAGPPMSTPLASPVANPALPAANPALSATTPAALRLDLSWMDRALFYRGVLVWDGRTTAANLSVDVTDRQTMRSLGHRDVIAYGHPDAPGRNVFSSQIMVPGDSQTPGVHVHTVNLVFEQQAGGNWAFVRNCTAPGECFEVPR
ncbi:MAG: TIR domain-containing protein [Rhizobacter sp.]|nr:TIR domain-containing protein [Rhizobacter sp.]